MNLWGLRATRRVGSRGRTQAHPEGASVILSHKAAQRAVPYLFLAPTAVLVMVLLLVPVANGFMLSLQERDLFNPTGRFTGLTNFIKLGDDPIFWRALLNTVQWTVVVVLAQYLFGLGLALLLNADVRGRGVFRALVLVPWVIPQAISAIAWKWLYAEQYGVLNALLRDMGLIKANVAWLGLPETVMWAVTAVGIWKGVPFVAIVLLAALQALEREQVEAAVVDGAGGWQVFRFITIPHLRYTSFIVLALSTIWTFNQFDLTHVLTRGGPGYASQLLSTYVYQLFMTAFDFGKAAAVAVLMLITVAFLAWAYIRRIVYHS